MVQSVPAREIGRRVEVDGETTMESTITDLYNDLLLEWMHRRLETADEYLDEVRPSGWAEAPGVPDSYTDLLSDHPYTEEYDDSRQRSSGAPEPAFSDWSDKVLKLHKAIESAFGLQDETFSYDDVEGLSDNPYNGGSYKPVFSDKLEPEDFVKHVDSGKHGKKVWIVNRSWNRDTNQQSPVADGGRTVYDWSTAIDRMEDADVVRDEARDWFTGYNWDDFVDLYRHAQTLDTLLDELRRERLWIVDSETVDEFTREQLKDVLDACKSDLQDVFSTIRELVVVGHDCIAGFAEHWGKDLFNELDRYQPHKRQDRQRQRVEAKKFAVIDTYITPLLTYPDLLPDTQKLYQFEEVVTALLEWLWVSFEDLTTHVEEPDNTPDLQDMILQILRTQKEAPAGDDHVPWTTIVKRIQYEHPDSPSASRIYSAAQIVHRTGKRGRETDYRGLRVQDTAPNSRDPELVVELVTDTFTQRSFDDRWSDIMCTDVNRG